MNDDIRNQETHVSTGARLKIESQKKHNAVMLLSMISVRYRYLTQLVQFVSLANYIEMKVT